MQPHRTGLGGYRSTRWYTGGLSPKWEHSLEGETKMFSAKRRDVVLAVDLERPVRSEELLERLLNTLPGVTAVVVTTEPGPLLAFSFREGTFGNLPELLGHLRTVVFAYV